jgi:hypothetical protein
MESVLTQQDDFLVTSATSDPILKPRSKLLGKERREGDEMFVSFFLATATYHG